jgi:predicted nucleic acid-binding protein
MARTPRHGAPVSAFVIDSSMALSWCFEDEASPKSDALFEQVRDQGAVVPELWHLEVANVLLQAERRGRITTADVSMRLDLIAELPIATDNQTTARAWHEILALARAEELTTYDAIFGTGDALGSPAANQG